MLFGSIQFHSVQISLSARGHESNSFRVFTLGYDKTPYVLKPRWYSTRTYVSHCESLAKPVSLNPSSGTKSVQVWKLPNKLSLNQFGLDKPKTVKPKQSRFRFLAQATSQVSLNLNLETPKPVKSEPVWFGQAQTGRNRAVFDSQHRPTVRLALTRLQELGRFKFGNSQTG